MATFEDKSNLKITPKSRFKALLEWKARPNDMSSGVSLAWLTLNLALHRVAWEANGRGVDSQKGRCKGSLLKTDSL